jgi:RCR-type E3 ubiquitin transferase
VTFGSNRHGQLGVGDVRNRIGPQFVLLPTSVVVAQVAAGANHCVVRTTDGLVYTFGKHHNGQLGRDGRSSSVWFASPGLVEGFGADSKKTATWVSRNGYFETGWF